jgi:hypothetical protein
MHNLLIIMSNLAKEGGLLVFELQKLMELFKKI